MIPLSNQSTHFLTIFLQSQYIYRMSSDQIRRLKLLKSLDSPSQTHSKSQPKRKLSINSMSFTQNLRKLNKNKKYMLEEERNTEIQRDNRMLYEKIMGHFQSLKDSMSIMQSRHKWRKRKCKNHGLQEDARSNATSNLVSQQLKYLSRVKTQQPQELSTLFTGNHQIDGVPLKIKITLDKDHYCLKARNNSVQISLQMDSEDYLRLHHRQLLGNPCNIFQYLEIDGNKIRFRTTTHVNHKQRQKKSQKESFF